MRVKVVNCSIYKRYENYVKLNKYGIIYITVHTQCIIISGIIIGWHGTE